MPANMADIRSKITITQQKMTKNSVLKHMLLLQQAFDVKKTN